MRNNQLIQKKILKNKVCIIGDHYTWEGQKDTDSVMEKYREPRINDNSQRLIEMCQIFYLNVMSIFLHTNMCKNN